MTATLMTLVLIGIIVAVWDVWWRHDDPRDWLTPSEEDSDDDPPLFL